MATFFVSVNGSIYSFLGDGGLRQGDSISPLLFVICLEYLSRSIKVAMTGTEFNYHPKCAPQANTHLAFADDLMLFCRGDNTSV
jgi:hypothetical protein